MVSNSWQSSKTLKKIIKRYLIEKRCSISKKIPVFFLTDLLIFFIDYI